MDIYCHIHHRVFILVKKSKENPHMNSEDFLITYLLLLIRPIRKLYPLEAIDSVDLESLIFASGSDISEIMQREELTVDECIVRILRDDDVLRILARE